MAVYRPSYKDPKTGDTKQSAVWWYNFTYAGKRIQESSKSTRKTVAVEAEKKRRRELEQGFNAIKDTRKERIKSIAELADDYLDDYRLRNPRSIAFAEWAAGHVKRVLGKTMVVDVTEETIATYQRTRLKEGAAAKSVNMEVTTLLRLLGDAGDLLRLRMKRKKTLKLAANNRVAKAYSEEEKAAMLVEAKRRRSPAIYPALMLALNAGMRASEIKGLQWERLDLAGEMVTVGKSKTDAGEGRTIPLNREALEAMREHEAWYLEKFGETRPEWYVFPFGKPQPTDPTKPMVTLKTVWGLVREKAGVTGRWHDSRHTFITELAESGEASDETIRDIAGHVSPQMLKHYSHIRMEAKRRAVAALSGKPKKEKIEGKK
ncbi:hypothetical protein F183_A29820 [Bryobacterales bacterium F-183]|nr:hypothetical protein F183_A29820 [Bryobacterales bacterium F-183]